MQAVPSTAPRASTTPYLRAARVGGVKPRARSGGCGRREAPDPAPAGDGPGPSTPWTPGFRRRRRAIVSLVPPRPLRGAKRSAARRGAAAQSTCHVSRRAGRPRSARGVRGSETDGGVLGRRARGCSVSPGPLSRRRRCRHQPHRPAARCTRHEVSHAPYIARATTSQVKPAARATRRRQRGLQTRAAGAALPHLN